MRAQWGRRVLSDWEAGGCYFQTKDYILKAYFALKMIKLLHSIVPVTGLEKFLYLVCLEC